MNLNLILTLPIIGPFLLLGLARAVWFLAGAEWNYPAFTAFSCLFMGIPMGWAAMVVLLEYDLRFTLSDLIKAIKGGV